jgi:hypothetical protein
METGLHLFSALAEFNVPAPVTRLSRRRNDKVKSMRQLFQNDYRTREETALAVDFCRHSLQHSPTRYHAPKQAAACAQFRAASPSTRSKQEIASYRIIIHSAATSLFRLPSHPLVSIARPRPRRSRQLVRAACGWPLTVAADAYPRERVGSGGNVLLAK